MPGALRMELRDGRHFDWGSGLTDALRRNSSPVVTLATYRYRELTESNMQRFLSEISASA
jgi:DNA ligase-1